MGKEFKPQPRGGGGNFPKKGPYNKGGNRGFNDQGPPAYVVPYATFVHKAENNLLLKCTDLTRFPKFNRGVYLENKAKVGSVDQILGPVNSFYFSVKPAQGVNPKSFNQGQVFYMNPDDLLSTDRFTKPQAPRPKGPPGQKFGGRPQQGGFKRGGPPSNFRGGQRGGSFGRGPPRGRGR